MRGFAFTIQSRPRPRYARVLAYGEILAGMKTLVTAPEFWPLLAAPLLSGIALLLALGFRRNRAVIVLAILTFSALALAGVIEQGERGTDAARMFAPWLLLAAAAMPEPRLFARRNPA